MDLILFGFCSFMADRLLSDHFVVADLPLAEWLEGFSCCDCWDRWAGTFCSPAVGSLCNFLRQRRCATLIRKAFCSNPVHLYTHLCAYILILSPSLTFRFSLYTVFVSPNTNLNPPGSRFSISVLVASALLRLHSNRPTNQQVSAAIVAGREARTLFIWRRSGLN